MASQQSTVDFILEQAAGAGAVSAKKMFGEYGLYLEGRMVALVCDDQLFVKPTAGGRTYLGDCAEASPYPGAKPCFLIAGDRCEDSDWLAGLFKATWPDLPLPEKRRGARGGTRPPLS